MRLQEGFRSLISVLPHLAPSTQSGAAQARSSPRRGAHRLRLADESGRDLPKPLFGQKNRPKQTGSLDIRGVVRSRVSVGAKWELTGLLGAPPSRLALLQRDSCMDAKS